MSSTADDLALWAVELDPAAEDLDLADRALLDTVAVAVAARTHPVMAIAAGLPETARWAVAGHVLDFDDLHMESTTHVSVVCVPAVLSTGGGARAYLAAAGVMARLGVSLGWSHYAAGWHVTSTAGAPAAAVGAAIALGLDPPWWPPRWRSPCPQPEVFSARSARTPSPCRSASPPRLGYAQHDLRPLVPART